MSSEDKLTGLARSLIRNVFANDEKEETQKEIYGTVVRVNGEKKVQLDGAEDPVDCEFDVGCVVGDRVRCSLQNHSVHAEYNITNPAVGASNRFGILEAVDNKLNLYYKDANDVEHRSGSINLSGQNPSSHEFGIALDNTGRTRIFGTGTLTLSNRSDRQTDIELGDSIVARSSSGYIFLNSYEGSNVVTYANIELTHLDNVKHILFGGRNYNTQFMFDNPVKFATMVPVNGSNQRQVLGYICATYNRSVKDKELHIHFPDVLNISSSVSDAVIVADKKITANGGIATNTLSCSGNLTCGSLSTTSQNVRGAINELTTKMGYMPLQNLNKVTSKAVADRTLTNISYNTIPPGKWLIVFYADWSQNSDGYRLIAMGIGSYLSTWSPPRNLANTTGGTNYGETYHQLSVVCDFSSSTTIYFSCGQTSGKTLTIYPQGYAIRIG